MSSVMGQIKKVTHFAAPAEDWQKNINMDQRKWVLVTQKS
jgi:hypothetical protein